MRGRKPKPTAQKALQGTLQKCRTNTNEPEFGKITKIPPPPKWFTKLGKKLYRLTSTELANIGVLQSINLPLLTSYCNLMALHLETEEELSGKPRVQALKNPDGSISKIVPNPYHKISRDALEDARKIASEFGLTPAAQSKIIANIKGSDDPDDADFK